MPRPPALDTASGANIFKIVYRSYVVDPEDIALRQYHIGCILDESRAWNPKHGITGALLLSAIGYAQVLEGPPHAVKALFGHIACDSRHQRLELLYNDYHAERDFGNWSMAVVGRPGEDDIEVASTAYDRNIVLADGADDIRLMLRWLLIEDPLLKASA